MSAQEPKPYVPKSPKRRGVNVSSYFIHPEFDQQTEYVDYLRERLRDRGEL